MAPGEGRVQKMSTTTLKYKETFKKYLLIFLLNEN